MQIEYRTGDILEQRDVAVIVHGCNARGVMGKGLALAVRRRHPEAYLAYRRRYEDAGSLGLGDVVFARCVEPSGRWIANLVSQDDYRRGAKAGAVHADLDAIERGVALVDAFIVGLGAAGEARVAFPLLGAGLAGGDWREIAPRIEAQARHFIPTVYTLDGRVPA